MNEHLSNVGVVPVLPGWNNWSCGRFPADLIGAEILNIGMPDLPPRGERSRPEGGGLVIDYRTAAGDTKRVVYAFNELAMWEVWPEANNAEATIDLPLRHCS